jgi:catecholate siderophore receptor
MDTEVVEGTTGNNAAGSSARWSPDLTATFWSTYNLGDRFTFGGGARYIGEQDRVVVPGTDLTTQNVPVIPDAWVADALARFNLTNNVSFQLNVYNVFDEDYISTLNNSGARLTLGAPRSAYLTLAARF